MRRQDREVTDEARIEQIIDSCGCCRVAFNTPAGPDIVPLNFGYALGAPAKFYFHGAKEGRKIDLMGAGTQVGFELDGAHALGQAEQACKHTWFYQSVIGTGYLAPVEDREEKKRALSCIMAHYRKDQTFSFTDAQADAVAVFCLTVQTMSCKEHR